MTDERPDQEDKRKDPPSEGVRIIGAEEAAEALERGDVAQRRGDDQPRYGDRPKSATSDGPRPVLRFPLGSSSDPRDIERPTVAPVDPVSEQVELPHWTEPPTGQVPQILPDQPGDEADVDDWTSFATSTRWRDDARSFDDAEGFEDMAAWADAEDEAPMGALDDRERPTHDDYFTFADLDDDTSVERSVFAENDRGFPDDWADGAAAEPTGGPEVEEAPRRRRTVAAAPAPSRRSSRTDDDYRPQRTARPQGGDRDMGVAVAVGVGLLALALILFRIGPTAAMVLVTAIVALAAAELFGVLRQAGYQPLPIAGIAGSVGLVLGAYNNGTAIIPAILFLTTAVCLLHYLVGAADEAPVMNVGVTLLGVLWVGLGGSFAALMLGLGDPGIGLLLAAIVGTIGYDVGGLFVGKNAGSKPLSAASPNKTIEGLLGGMVVATIAVTVGASVIGFGPISGLGEGLLVGLAVALSAPLGDLCESLVKRDLGVKDMGAILPGHGGLLDRFDALLFVLPAVYLLASVRDFFSRSRRSGRTASCLTGEDGLAASVRSRAQRGHEVWHGASGSDAWCPKARTSWRRPADPIGGTNGPERASCAAGSQSRSRSGQRAADAARIGRSVPQVPVAAAPPLSLMRPGPAPADQRCPASDKARGGPAADPMRGMARRRASSLGQMRGHAGSLTGVSTSVAILGSTGSIGTQALSVIEAEPERFSVAALGAGSSVDARRAGPALAPDRRRHRRRRPRRRPACSCAGGDRGGRGRRCAGQHRHHGRRVRQRRRRLRRPGRDAGGAGGRHPAGAGQQGVADRRRPRGASGAGGAGSGELVPVDSEHCAVHQSLRAQHPHGAAGEWVRRIVLTASGGPFRGRTKADLADVTIDDALAHPTWAMGPKITIDSSTLMNKGLEVIEANELFGVGYDRIEVVVHPQSIVHSMAEFTDGTTIAQLSLPDMRLPIAYALAYPDRVGTAFGRIDWTALRRLDFEAPDLEAFPCLGLAYDAGRMGETAPAWLNAANEEAVAAFLGGRIRWISIPDVLTEVLSRHDGGLADSVEAVIEADRIARTAARAVIAERFSE